MLQAGLVRVSPGFEFWACYRLIGLLFIVCLILVGFGRLWCRVCLTVWVLCDCCDWFGADCWFSVVASWLVWCLDLVLGGVPGLACWACSHGLLCLRCELRVYCRFC